MEVAGNPSTPVDVLSILASDSSIGVRMEVAGNSSTPVDDVRHSRLRLPARTRLRGGRETQGLPGGLRSLAGDMKSYIRGPPQKTRCSRLSCCSSWDQTPTDRCAHGLLVTCPPLESVAHPRCGFERKCVKRCWQRVVNPAIPFWRRSHLTLWRRYAEGWPATRSLIRRCCVSWPPIRLRFSLRLLRAHCSGGSSLPPQWMCCPFSPSTLTKPSGDAAAGTRRPRLGPAIHSGIGGRVRRALGTRLDEPTTVENTGRLL